MNIKTHGAKVAVTFNNKVLEPPLKRDNTGFLGTPLTTWANADMDDKSHMPERLTMPRQARLDVPGTLHHVIVRGIEGKKIVKYDQDRKDFVSRIGTIASEVV